MTPRCKHCKHYVQLRAFMPMYGKCSKLHYMYVGYARNGASVCGPDALLWEPNWWMRTLRCVFGTTFGWEYRGAPEWSVARPRKGN